MCYSVDCTPHHCGHFHVIHLLQHTKLFSSKLVYGNHYSTRPTTFPKLSGDSFAALCSAAPCMPLRWTQQGERITEQTPCHPLFPPLSRARCWFMFVSYYDDRQGLCVQENETLPRLFLFSCMCTFACASILMSNLQEDGISVLALLYMHAISCACQDHSIPHYTGISLLRLRTFVEVRTKKKNKVTAKSEAVIPTPIYYLIS